MFPKKCFIFFIIITLAQFISCSSSEKGENSVEKKAEIYFSYGTSELLNKNYTAALEHLLKAAELNPKNSQIQNNLGMVYYFKKKRPLAEKQFILAKDLDPKNSDAANNLASLYFEEGRLQDAEREYRSITENLLYDQQYRVYYNLGLIKLKQNRKEEAKKNFISSIQENSNYCPAHFKLGELALNTKHYKEALEHFHSSNLGTCYNEPLPQYYLGITLVHLERIDLAKEKFLDVIKRFPRTIYAQMANKKLAKMDDHLQHFQSAIKRPSLDEEGEIGPDIDEKLKYPSPDFTNTKKRDRKKEVFISPNF